MMQFNRNSNDPYDKEELAREEEAWRADQGASDTDSEPTPEGDSKARAELAEQCGDLIASANVMDEIDGALRESGAFAGSTAIVKILYLALISRHLPQPVSVAVRGESSSGKSFAIEQALRFVSPEAAHVLSSMSDKALAYSEEDFAHRVIVLYENEALGSSKSAYLVRSLLSEGKLIYEYTDFEGGRKSVRIEKEGPTGLLTSCAGKIDYELGTRLLSVNVDEGPAVTQAILASEARKAEGETEDIELAEFQALDRWIGAGDSRVVVPYADQIAQACDAKAVRMRRDFRAVLGLVCASALVHQEGRAKDHRGCIVASGDDYRAIHGLTADVVAKGSGQTISTEIRETVEAVRRLFLNQEVHPEERKLITIAALEQELDLHRTSVTRRVTAAITLELLMDLGRHGRREIAPGNPLPEDRGVLPSPDELDLD